MTSRLCWLVGLCRTRVSTCSKGRTTTSKDRSRSTGDRVLSVLLFVCVTARFDVSWGCMFEAAVLASSQSERRGQALVGNIVTADT